MERIIRSLKTMLIIMAGFLSIVLINVICRYLPDTLLILSIVPRIWLALEIGKYTGEKAAEVYNEW